MAATAVQRSQPVPVATKLKSSDFPAKGSSDTRSSDQNSPIQKLQGSWKLVGKTERQDECGSLDTSSMDGPILQFGSTRIYLSPEPISCEESCTETRFSFEVTDACSSSSSSSSVSDYTAVGESLDFEQDAEGGFDGPPQTPEDPGVCDVILKADGTIEGDASASPSCSVAGDILYKFSGCRISRDSV